MRQDICKVILILFIFQEAFTEEEQDDGESFIESMDIFFKLKDLTG